MGIKSTVTLQRADALDRLASMKLEIKREKLRAKLSAKSNRFIEDELERLNDKLSGGQGFDNYIVID